MILVTGANGHLGSAVIKSLLVKIPASQIVALVRDENKAAHLKELGVRIRLGDYNNKTALELAMKDVEKVLLISGLSRERLAEHKNVIDAAKKAGVKHIVYTGVTMNNADTSPLKPLMISHFQTEDYIKENGIAYTFLRNTLYAEVVPFYIGDQALHTGVNFPAGTGSVPYVHRADLAAAAAIVLTGDGHENQVYQLTNGQLYSFQDVADKLSEIAGSPVTYTDPDPQAFEAHLKQAGTPEILIMIRTGFAASIRQGDFELVTDDLEKLLGRKPLPLESYLRAHYVG